MEKFCLKWNDFHGNISKSFQKLRNEEDFFDVTLVGDDGKHVTAHKLVLSSSSEYFKTLFTNSKKYFQSHAFICLEGLQQHDLNNILDYIYQGEVQIHQQDLDRFLEIAQRLKLEGLIGGKQQDDEEIEYREEKIIDPTEDVSENISKGERKIVRDVRTKVNPIMSIEASDIQSIEELDQKVEESYSKNAMGIFVCHHCSQSFRKRCNIKEHVEIHFDGLSFPCSICETVLRSRKTFRNHQRKHY